MIEATAPPLATGRLEGWLGFHLRMASAAMARDFAVALDGLDLTQKQCAVLELIAGNAGVSQIDLATRLGTDRATMMAIVARLERRHLVSRGRSPRDGRRQILGLTGEGMALLVEARRLIDAHEAGFKTRLGPERTAQLIALLREIEA